VTLRVVLAEDHRIVREGLRSLLGAGGRFEVVGETGDGLDVESLVAQHRPDLLVVDVVLPGLDGIEATRRVRKSCPDTRVVVLSMHAAEPFVLEALAAGASAYVLKDTTSTELIRALLEASAGRRYLSPPLTLRSLEIYEEGTKGRERSDPLVSLSPREREVLQLVAGGLTSSQIAERLGLSPRTVESHRANLMRKIGISTTAGLIRFVVERGLLLGTVPALPTKTTDGTV
jgi:DNA-binding NarL/FixJ family response regulator